MPPEQILSDIADPIEEWRGPREYGEWVQIGWKLNPLKLAKYLANLNL